MNPFTHTVLKPPGKPKSYKWIV